MWCEITTVLLPNLPLTISWAPLWGYWLNLKWFLRWFLSTKQPVFVANSDSFQKVFTKFPVQIYHTSLSSIDMIMVIALPILQSMSLNKIVEPMFLRFRVLQKSWKWRSLNRSDPSFIKECSGHEWSIYQLTANPCSPCQNVHGSKPYACLTHE